MEDNENKLRCVVAQLKQEKETRERTIKHNGWGICSFLFGIFKTYSYLCKKITYTPCYVLCCF